MIRYCLFLLAFLCSGTLVAQNKGLENQYQDLIETCHLYERHKNDPDLRYVEGQILLVISKETPIPEVGAMFEQQGLLVKKLYPVGSAQLALVQVPPGEEARWITTMSTYKPIACGYLNFIATPQDKAPEE